MKEIKQNGARNEKGRLDMYARTHHPSALIRAFERTMNSVPVPKKKKKKELPDQKASFVLDRYDSNDQGKDWKPLAD